MANEGLYFKNSEDIAAYFPAYDLSETKKIKGFKNSSNEDVLESTVHYPDNG
jgi:hypothetical protein